MPLKPIVTRRTFMGGAATALGFLGIKPGLDLFAQEAAPRPRGRRDSNDYDSLAKLANNENPWGPPESVMKAMIDNMKYANRYGYPDGNITQEIAKHHGVGTENVILAAGSGEILRIVGLTFLDDTKKVVGVEPSYSSVYQHATSLKTNAILLPLNKDFTQNIDAMIKATKQHYREVGFVYLVSPNNPTGVVVPKQDVKKLLDNIPEDVVVLIDEAYHHFVEDPNYETSMPYVQEGRPVIVARTFSKIVGLAGMRLGYAVAPRELIQKMNPNSTGTINAIVKHGGVAALNDLETQNKVKRLTIEQRTKTTKELHGLGFSTIPSQGNFFMVHLKRPVQPVIEEFRQRGVLVGRPFPPMTDWLRVSIGTPEEMDRFSVAWKQIFTTAATNGSKSG
jgi:histidinol-phosphate aminotransferase